MENKYEILEDMGVLGSKGSMEIHLTKTSWFGKEASFDIRPWLDDMSRCGKGITLNDDQAFALYQLLKKEFECE